MIIPLNSRKETERQVLEINALIIGINNSQRILEKQKKDMQYKLDELLTSIGIKENQSVEIDIINQEIKY